MKQFESLEDARDALDFIEGLATSLFRLAIPRYDRSRLLTQLQALDERGQEALHYIHTSAGEDYKLYMTPLEGRDPGSFSFRIHAYTRDGVTCYLDYWYMKHSQAWFLAGSSLVPLVRVNPMYLSKYGYDNVAQ